MEFEEVFIHKYCTYYVCGPYRIEIDDGGWTGTYLGTFISHSPDLEDVKQDCINHYESNQ